ncbi:hypothetical protein [Chitinophaga nivalis]|uniref:Uncharacterized protein n=1 Tax=Chitinophaga nivalis TaxID=2991709 RepID=A0ABT3IKU2_9BACT|nr:hypothetical protein [Chitinophaga nivalis]MCW3465738.1 hypothetical protein [Chitinophaga nivalis]MCW3484571.1 hypothetical protein [Chitinophaga nivalis]
MKRIIVLAALATLAFSCKKDKEETGCYECTLTSKTNGIDMGASSTTTHCDLTESQKNDMERSGTTTTTINEGGVNITMETKVSCKKK